MADDLFEGLPPPAEPKDRPNELIDQSSEKQHQGANSSADLLRFSPKPILKSALKRPKPVDQPNPEVHVKEKKRRRGIRTRRSKGYLSLLKLPCKTSAPGKRLKFKTTTDASETQIIEAMQKIASHIKNPSKFNKASKLAIQLIEAGSVKPGTVDYFFAILEASMSTPTSCNEPSVRADYHALFLAAENASEFLTNKQKNQVRTWTIRAVVANDLHTDDSFVFSKAAGLIKEAISDLPIATKSDDMEEAEALKEKTVEIHEDNQTKQDVSLAAPLEHNVESLDPFGLDAFLTSSLKKSEKAKGKKDEDTKIFLKSQREALIFCLEVAARRYKTPWCQTVIDILVKHASDNVSRFTSLQREAIEKLWASIKEQQTRRKQGKSVSGKLDVNGFEWLQQKYAGEKISIRRSVGGCGERRAEQWLG